MRLRAALALLLTASGCSTTYRVPKTELTRLDGWFVPELANRPGDSGLKPPQRVTLRDTEGREHLFTEDTPLVIVQRGGATLVEKYIDLSVDAQRFRGVPLDAFRRTVEVPLSEVQSTSIQEISTSRTALLCGGLAAGVVGAIIGVRLAIGSVSKPPPGEPCGGADCEF
jgi:hypothetical protein